MIYPGTGAPAQFAGSSSPIGRIALPVPGSFTGAGPNRPGPGGPNRGFPGRGGIGFNRGFNRGVVGYPFFFGGYYTGYPAQPAVQELYPPQVYEEEERSPVVIINQYFEPETVRPVLRDYRNTPLPESPQPESEQPAPPPGRAAVQNAEPPIFLIAMKDHTIFAASAYWVEGGMLHYITTQGSHNSASLDLVDREFSERLNTDRRVEFKLPAQP
jgi:hypothetical protein